MITVRNEVAKVMFLHLDLSVHRGWGLPQCHAGDDHHPSPEQPPPSRRLDSCGRYASPTGSAFLLLHGFHCSLDPLLLEMLIIYGVIIIAINFERVEFLHWRNKSFW